MRKTNLCWLVLLCGLLGGCNKQDTECLARIGGKVLSRTEGWTGRFQQSLGQDGGPVSTGLGLAGRITVRLSSDKGLAGANIEVKTAGNIVELKGTITTTEQRRRAVDLVETTIGVEKVVESLQIIPSQKEENSLP